MHSLVRSAIVALTLVLIGGVAPVSAASGLHVELGPPDAHGCASLQVMEGGSVITTLPGSSPSSEYCFEQQRSAVLRNGILVFDWVQPVELAGLGADGQLWGTDGTAGGTALLLHFARYRRSGSWRVVGPMAVAEEQGDGIDGSIITTTYGTPATTREVRGRHPGYLGLGAPYVAVGDRIVYAAWWSGRGREPIISDGTVEGTHPLLDVRPGPRGSAPRWFRALPGGRATFTADDGHGRTRWVTDGTSRGTQRAS
ncbi:MAG: hypothetical protein U0869_20885 [Chloroflexota bacterium]